jgi:hypothetical protein
MKDLSSFIRDKNELNAAALDAAEERAAACCLIVAKTELT